MRLPDIRLASILLSLAACAPGPDASPTPAKPAGIAPDPQLTGLPVPAPAISVSGAAAETRDALLAEAGRGSLRGLARIANANPNFMSNAGGQDHLDYWDLMRRAGIDPNLRLRRLLAEPAGLREVDGERWYVWPDLAAREPGALLPERLSFADRRRLEELIGEEGIARLRAGEGYPAMRTAIAEDGRWIYFVLGMDVEEE